jgi:coumaroylquinate(coumaroylshikimate) 3'-monooxygenase
MAELFKNPRVQHKAQEELDRVIEWERVITEADFTTLPYLQCVAKESLRLHPQRLHNLGRSGPDRAGDEFRFGSEYSFPCSVETGWWRRACLWVQRRRGKRTKYCEGEADLL